MEDTMMTPAPVPTPAPSEWQDRSFQAAASRVDAAREREAAAAEQYEADRDAEQREEPAGHQTETVKPSRSTKSKTAESSS